MYRKYLVYLDDGVNVFKVAIAAKSKDKAIEWCAGNGEVIAVKDVTEEYHISADKVSRALEDAGFGDLEIDFINRALSGLGITE